MKKLLCIILILLAGLQITVKSVSAAQNYATVLDGEYVIMMENGIVALNNYAGINKNANPVTGWEFDGSTDIVWYVEHIGNGKYILKTINGRVLDVYHGGTNKIANGLKVGIYTYNDPSFQEWYINPIGNGIYTFELAAFPGYYLTNASTVNGARFTIQTDANNSSQRFYFCDLNGGKVNAEINQTEVTSPTPPIMETLTDTMFDYIYYANSYSDLKNAFGYDEKALKNHWLKNGIKEGRVASPIFDVKYYLENNSDLQAAFSKNYQKAYNHFLNTGYKESRKTSPNFHILSYANRYSDLREAYKNDLKRYYIHYMQCGRYEDRVATFEEGLNTPLETASNSELSEEFKSLKEKYPDKTIWKKTYNNQAKECVGYAYTLGFELTGVDTYKWAKGYDLSSLKPGDIIAGSDHTIMVTAVNGGTITYTDCNYIGANKIQWNATIEIKDLSSCIGKLNFIRIKP